MFKSATFSTEELVDAILDSIPFFSYRVSEFDDIMFGLHEGSRYAFNTIYIDLGKVYAALIDGDPLRSEIAEWTEFGDILKILDKRRDRAKEILLRMNRKDLVSLANSTFYIRQILPSGKEMRRAIAGSRVLSFGCMSILFSIFLVVLVGIFLQ
jgi:hypothetical protein